MITVFKKIWNFAEKEQSNIQKSIIVGFLCAAFNAMQMGGVYYVLVKIFVVENGKIESCGQHEELLETSKVYSSLWKAAGKE